MVQHAAVVLRLAGLWLSFPLTGRAKGRSWVGRFNSWDKVGGGGHCATHRRGLDASIQPEANQEKLSRPPGIKKNLTEDFHTMLSECVTHFWELVTKVWKVREDRKKKGEKQPSLLTDKSREPLMQHDPVGLALKIPSGRRAAAISICLITWWSTISFSSSNNSCG